VGSLGLLSIELNPGEHLRTIYKIWLIVCAALVCLAGVLTVSAILIGRPLAAAESYVNEANRAIIEKWSESELLVRASPELRSVAAPDDLANLFERFRLLGELEEYRPAKGYTTLSLSTGSLPRLLGSYQASARFKNGTVLISTKVVLVNGRWRLLQFYIQPQTEKGKSAKTQGAGR